MANPVYAGIDVGKEKLFVNVYLDSQVRDFPTRTRELSECPGF